MKTKTLKIKLTESDKMIIQANSSICTDAHGNGCPLSLTFVLNSVEEVK